MRNESAAPRPVIRGATKKEGPGSNQDHSRFFQDTAPAPYCRCPRSSDLWLCAGRPELVRHPDGSRCALGATVAASGNDHDPRGELIRALKEAGCHG